MLNKLLAPVLRDAQKQINEKYEDEGLTDEVLELQVKLNQVRHILDLADADEYIYEGYVQ